MTPPPLPRTPSLAGGSATALIATSRRAVAHPSRYRRQHSCRTGAWKTELQAQLCNSFGLTVTVAHYPTGASKWNPIEHRLFSEISKTGRRASRHYPKVLNFIRNTCTRTGACSLGLPRPRQYPTGTSPDPDTSPSLSQTTFDFARWNYTLANVNLLLRQPLGPLPHESRLGNAV